VRCRALLGVTRKGAEAHSSSTPYLYNLLWRYHYAYEPVVRPTFFDFPDDPHCWREGDEMMVGPSLLAAPVVEPGHVHRKVYLPFGAHWYDFWSGEVFKGGQTITRPAPKR
jgi:alpha-glucosidase